MALINPSQLCCGVRSGRGRHRSHLRCSYRALNVPEGGTALAGAAMGCDSVLMSYSNYPIHMESFFLFSSLIKGIEEL